jgi:L-histidine Nalpha-methyltransferase
MTRSAGPSGSPGDSDLPHGVPEHLRSARARMLADVRWGLARAQKELPSKYFYDTRGSELFEEITRLPEYYPTRTERALLESDVAQWIGEVGPGSLVELGAGSGRKTRILLEAMLECGSGRTYAPVDIAGEFLEETARGLRDAYPHLEVVPQVRDITTRLDFAEGMPRPVLFALIGSTIGNFDPKRAVDLLSSVRDAMTRDDYLLLGADLQPSEGKTVGDIEAAYNDARGVTAEFNLNILEVLNHGLGTDFEPSNFAHRASYDARLGRIEMHLVALREQTVQVPGAEQIVIARGESIRTELSCKYDRPLLESLLGRVGLRIERWCTDGRKRYSLLLARLA